MWTNKRDLNTEVVLSSVLIQLLGQLAKQLVYLLEQFLIIRWQHHLSSFPTTRRITVACMVPEKIAGAQGAPPAITTGFKLILERQCKFVVLLLRAMLMAMNGLQSLSSPFLLMAIPGKLTEIDKTLMWYDAVLYSYLSFNWLNQSLFGKLLARLHYILIKGVYTFCYHHVSSYRILCLIEY